MLSFAFAFLIPVASSEDPGAASATELGRQLSYAKCETWDCPSGFTCWENYCKKYSDLPKPGHGGSCTYDVQCPEFDFCRNRICASKHVCTTPVNLAAQGYVEETSPNPPVKMQYSFNVVLACAPGFTGSPVATACAPTGGDYTPTGCFAACSDGGVDTPDGDGVRQCTGWTGRAWHSCKIFREKALCGVEEYASLRLCCPISCNSCGERRHVLEAKAEVKRLKDEETQARVDRFWAEVARNMTMIREKEQNEHSATLAPGLSKTTLMLVGTAVTGVAAVVATAVFFHFSRRSHNKNSDIKHSSVKQREGQGSKEEEAEPVESTIKNLDKREEKHTVKCLLDKVSKGASHEVLECDENKEKIYFIVGSSASTVLLIVALLSYYCCCRKKRTTGSGAKE